MRRILVWIGLFMCSIVAFGQSRSSNPSPVKSQGSGPSLTAVLSVDSQRALVNQYCVGCHNDKLKSGGFSWTQVDLAHPEQKAELIEKVIRKIRAGMMPPAKARRPDSETAKGFATALETEIDQA